MLIFLRKKGFTLIEILIVFSLASVLMLFGIRLLNTFTDFSFETSAYKNIDYYFLITRKKALSTGKKYTLELNLEEKIFGVREFIPRLDNTFDTTTDTLSEDSYDRTLKESKVKISTDEDSDEENKSIDWFIARQRLPKNFEKAFSISLLEIKGPILRLFFYPNGTSDSIIFQYSESGHKKYFYIPNNNQSSRTFLSEELEKYVNSDDLLNEVEVEPALIDLNSFIR